MFNSDVKMAQKLKLGKPDFPRWSLPEVWARLAGKEFRLEVVKTGQDLVDLAPRISPRWRQLGRQG